LRLSSFVPSRSAARLGFNLIEAVIVLGIVGLIVGGIWAAAGSAYENMRLENASNGLLSLVHAIRNAYGSTTTATLDVSVDTLANMGAVPADMLSTTAGNTSIQHQWSGPVITADASASAGAPAFSLTYAAVKTDSCNSFATRVAASARVAGLLSITTGGGAYLNLIGNTGAEPAAGGPQCASPTDDLIFVFSVRG
jgi:type II secretory pathway pseudopilin PulG